MKNRRAADIEESIPEFDAILASAPKDLLLMGDLSLAITHHIYQIMAEKGMQQKDLAIAMGKTEAEVSKLLSGMHNLTLRSIAKMQIALGCQLITVPQKLKEFNPVSLPESVDTFKNP